MPKHIKTTIIHKLGGYTVYDYITYGNKRYIDGVKDNNKNFIVKFNPKDFIKNGLISNNIIDICKYFKEIYGAPNITIDIKTYSINIEK